jgi:hypothetical protein
MLVAGVVMLCTASDGPEPAWSATTPPSCYHRVKEPPARDSSMLRTTDEQKCRGVGVNSPLRAVSRFGESRGPRRHTVLIIHHPIRHLKRDHLFADGGTIIGALRRQTAYE